ncbi:uncharacterized protein LOC111271446 isoform X2 [Varroa jacobsoni]|uniref:uncharacterized protein LOC111271446 isoform X2 n=1 Tax=Varroa jacobsoni TaxID=62625 RepID=UPI000BF5DEE5|nr:uncharacterized protein LOC111271446 isoform X2 [Varroa jacobsoni]
MTKFVSIALGLVAILFNAVFGYPVSISRVLQNLLHDGNSSGAFHELQISQGYKRQASPEFTDCIESNVHPFNILCSTYDGHNYGIIHASKEERDLLSESEPTITASKAPSVRLRPGPGKAVNNNKQDNLKGSKNNEKSKNKESSPKNEKLVGQPKLDLDKLTSNDLKSKGGNNMDRKPMPENKSGKSYKDGVTGRNGHWDNKVDLLPKQIPADTTVDHQEQQKNVKSQEKNSYVLSNEPNENRDRHQTEPKQKPNKEYYSGGSDTSENQDLEDEILIPPKAPSLREKSFKTLNKINAYEYRDEDQMSPDQKYPDEDEDKEEPTGEDYSNEYQVEPEVKEEMSAMPKAPHTFKPPETFHHQPCAKPIKTVSSNRELYMTPQEPNTDENLEEHEVGPDVDENQGKHQEASGLTKEIQKIIQRLRKGNRDSPKGTLYCVDPSKPRIFYLVKVKTQKDKAST